MKMHLLATLVLATACAPASAQTGSAAGASGGDRASPTGPANRNPPGAAAGTSSPGGAGAAGADARQACKTLVDAKARQDCIRQHPDGPGSTSVDSQREGGTMGSGSTNDTSVSPGTGSGGSETGRSVGGTGFPKGSSSGTGSGSSSGNAPSGSGR